MKRTFEENSTSSLESSQKKTKHHASNGSSSSAPTTVISFTDFSLSGMLASYQQSSDISHKHPMLHLLSFLPVEDLLLNVALVSKKLYRACMDSVEELVLDCDEMNLSSGNGVSEDVTQLIEIVNRFPRMKTLSLDGLEWFNDLCLSSLLEKLPPNLYDLHIRECGLDSPSLVDRKLLNSGTFQNPTTPSPSSTILQEKSPIQQLKYLRFSSCTFTSIEVRALKELLSLEFYDCSLGDGGLKLANVPKLEKLVLFKCANVSDLALLNTLKPLLVEELEDLNRSFNTQDEEIANGDKPARNDDDSIFDIHVNFRKRKYGALKKLFLTECEPLQNPVIQSNTLEEIKIINCKFISKPFISCPQLTKLQLNWCENLKNLSLACDNLRSIDLTGAGVTYSSSSQSNSQGSATKKEENTVLQNVVGSLKRFYGDHITITL
ncbi:hypothetical protein C9374_003196 [Naegleria lovaniensis]|uniref:F-box domain-containing protein n=1 Tax=Naegleria lovaniensis TaxID=51637 RepID=A0AA88GNS0_NAELO|nr:uncharacterized protein C9374_003196 [Naegleria lovaniensis]KAG2386047.1 hypothetical protein C9374_003196 [Naegleria lovaniensis]